LRHILIYGVIVVLPALPFVALFFLIRRLVMRRQDQGITPRVGDD
jgi:hypothetical protein